MDEGGVQTGRTRQGILVVPGRNARAFCACSLAAAHEHHPQWLAAFDFLSLVRIGARALVYYVSTTFVATSIGT